MICLLLKVAFTWAKKNIKTTRSSIFVAAKDVIPAIIALASPLIIT
jgi:hypothetical protein